jgi:hypothetical protein
MQEADAVGLLLVGREPHDHAPLQLAGRDLRALVLDLAAHAVRAAERAATGADARPQREPLLDQRRPRRELRAVEQRCGGGGHGDAAGIARPGSKRRAS